MRPASNQTRELEPSSSIHEPKYTGVRKRKWGKWVSEIRLPNSRERIWLGSYDSAEKAARAFDAASFCLRGTAAKFNFPDHPPNIPGGRSLSPSGIQAAAAQFANSVPDAVVVDPVGSTQTSTTTTTLNVVHDDYNRYGTGYEIFSGFDDYFMSSASIVSPRFCEYDHEEILGDGDVSQDPLYLWNF